MRYEEALHNCIFRYVSGSHQYGTNRPDSDTDYRGVFIAPLTCAFNLFNTKFMGSGTIKQTLLSSIDAIESGNIENGVRLIHGAMETDRGDLSFSVETVHNPNPKADEELHELRKFLKLAADCNPNVVEALYVDDLIEISSPEWELIREHRDWFLSKKARYTFAGYCIAQLKRIKIHRGYLLNPPDHKPIRQEFGLPENCKIKKEHQNAILSLPIEWLAENAREEVIKEKKYDEALRLWNSYLKWNKERNPLRKEMEKKWGYDVKHAAHLLRLSRCAKEILRDGKFLVRRPDAEELNGILRGEWKYEDIEAEANELDFCLENLYQNSPLPESPNRKSIANLYRQICERCYGISLL